MTRIWKFAAAALAATLFAPSQPDARTQAASGAQASLPSYCYTPAALAAKKQRREAAARGVPVSLYHMGANHFHGSSACERKDDVEALRWFRASAAKGYADAQMMVGFFYMNGITVPKDYRLAMRWFLLASNQHNYAAQAHIGLMYRDGMGVPKNPVAAFKFMKSAAEGKRPAIPGNQMAQYVLGVMYNGGLGVAKNDAEAARWFRVAAARGGTWASQAEKGLAAITPRHVPAPPSKPPPARVVGGGSGAGDTVCRPGPTYCATLCGCETRKVDQHGLCPKFRAAYASAASKEQQDKVCSGSGLNWR